MGWGDSPLPFGNEDFADDSEIEDTDTEEDYQPDMDSSDEDGLEDFDEDDDSLDKLISKSIAKGITPKRQYFKALTQDQYDKIIGKDAYAFLHGHEDEIIEVMTIGRDVSEHFKTISAIDVREVYWIIISNIEQMGWSQKDMVDQVLEKFPHLKQFEAERIINTELTRVLNYCKEFIAERGDLGLYNYGWTGPLDYRTTPMCWYLQTGELRDSDLKALHRAGHSKDDLPPIPEEGMPLEQLKETCRKVAECFGYDMISDWVMHINCRHTFARGNKRLDIEMADQSEVARIVDDLLDMPGGFGEEPYVDMEPITEDDKQYIPVYDGFDTMVFLNSIYNVPTMYDNPDADDIFIFEQMNETDVASWSRMVLQLFDEGLTEDVIIWAMQDTGNLEDDTIAYIVTNAEDIYARAENEGWI